MPEVKDEKTSWASIFKELLDTPPTQSIFRLYLLSFIICNKFVFLYIFFSDVDMVEKIKVSNWGNFTSGFFVSKYFTFISYPYVFFLNFYFTPIIIVAFILLISNYKIQNRSVYNWVYYWHESSLKNRQLKEEIEIVKLETQKIDAEKDNIAKKEEKKNFEYSLYYDKAPKPPKGKEVWVDEFRKLQKTSHYVYFKKFVQMSYYDKDNIFTENDITLPHYFSLFNYLLKVDAVELFTILEGNLTKFRFTEKGIFFIKYSEYDHEATQF